MGNDTLEMMKGQHMASPDDGGLEAALDKFFGDGDSPGTPAAEEQPKPTEQPKAEPPKQEPPKQEKSKQEEPKKEEAKPAAEVKEIKFEEEFTMAKEEAQNAPESFDEGAFDKETEKLSEGMEEHAGSKFKALRAELKELKQKTVSPEEKKRIEELEIKASEVDGLRKKLDELSNVSAKVRMESTEEFSKQVKEPADNLFSEVEKMAKRYEGDPKFLWNLVTSSDREEQAAAFKEHLGDFSDFDKTEVMTMIKSWNGILDNRDKLLAKAQEHIDGLDAKQAAEAQRILDENRKNVQAIQKDIWTKYRDIIPGFVDENGNETQTYKDLMAQSMALDFTRAKARDQALAAFSGVVLKHLVYEMNEMAKKLAGYEAADARSASGTPRTGAAVNNASSASESNSKPESFRDKFVNADLV